MEVLFSVVLIEVLILSVLFVGHVNENAKPAYEWMLNNCIQIGTCRHP